jgi:hypothetical protein
MPSTILLKNPTLITIDLPASPPTSPWRRTIILNDQHLASVVDYCGPKAGPAASGIWTLGITPSLSLVCQRRFGVESAVFQALGPHLGGVGAVVGGAGGG